MVLPPLYNLLNEATVQFLKHQSEYIDKYMITYNTLFIGIFVSTCFLLFSQWPQNPEFRKQFPNYRIFTSPEAPTV